MLNRHRIQRSRCLLAWAFLAAMVLTCPPALAQSGFFFVPTLTLEEVYDDNIFFDTENEVSDFITRLSPRIDIGVETATLDWILSYQNDAEWYRDLSELDSTTARSFGSTSLEVRLDRRWTLRGEAAYTKTNTAEDLSLTPGGGIPGLVGRFEAERLLFAGGADVRFSPRLSGGIDVAWVENDLVGFTRNETLAAQADVEQLLTPSRALLYGYLYRDYTFENESGAQPGSTESNSQDSNTAWVGLAQVLSETSDLELRVGPRVSSGDVEPYVLFRWQREYARGTTAVEARWDETTLLGESERLETRSLEASWTHEFSPKLELRSSAGYAYVSEPDFSTDIATFELAGTYRISPNIFLTAQYEFNAQQDNSDVFSSEGVNHGVVSLAVSFTLPRRGTERSPS